MTRLLPILFILIAIGLFFGYVNPTYTGPVAELREEIRSYDNALAAAKQFQEKEQQLIAARSSLPLEGVGRVEAFLPDSVDNVQLILDLNALAERSGITLSNFDVASGRTEQQGDQIMLESESPVDSLELSLMATGLQVLPHGSRAIPPPARPHRAVYRRLGDGRLLVQHDLPHLLAPLIL